MAFFHLYLNMHTLVAPIMFVVIWNVRLYKLHTQPIKIIDRSRQGRVPLSPFQPPLTSVERAKP
jgi:hypothetical protein